MRGGHLLSRWTRELDEETSWSLTTYYDRTERHVERFLLYDRDTINLDFQFNFRAWEYHAIVAGCGYRFSEDFLGGSFPIQFEPHKRAIDLFSYFVQDEITLLGDWLYLTLGSKFEHNDFTGFEIQPSARLLWTPGDEVAIWGAVSRAVRTPSRAEDDLRLRSVPSAVLPGLPGPPPLPGPIPVFPQLIGTRALEAEDLLAWEAGLRLQPTPEWYWDVALFLNEYDDLITTRAGAPQLVPGALPFLILPIDFDNHASGESYGFEIAGTYRVTDEWTLTGGYSFLRVALETPPGTTSTAEGDSPRNAFFMHSSWDLGDAWQVDLIGRYADHLPALGIPAYYVMDARLAWFPLPNLEAALVARHWLDRQHAEFRSDGLTGLSATEIEREVYGLVIWRY